MDVQALVESLVDPIGARAECGGDVKEKLAGATADGPVPEVDHGASWGGDGDGDNDAGVSTDQNVGGDRREARRGPDLNLVDLNL